MSVPRPGPLRWLWYAYGGSLPARYARWVLRDTTARTWWLRHLVRAVVQIAPFVIAIIVFVPGELWLRVTCSLGGTIMGFVFSISYMHETAEHRLMKAGYPLGTGPATRAERTADRDAAAASRYAARYRTPPDA